MPVLSPQAQVILMLAASNLLMNIAWYGHLKYRAAPLMLVILVAWAIAFFEYALHIPANRLGHQSFSAPQLKGIQEGLSILTFFLVSTLWLGEPITLRQLAGFALMIPAVYLVAGGR